MQVLECCSSIHDQTKEIESSQKMASKTCSANVYEIKIGKVNLIILDTPGFGDTRGSNVDKENSEKIRAQILSLEGANCIMIIQNGTESRMNDNLQYNFAKICEIMPKRITS